MARFTATLPDDVMKEVEKRIKDAPKMMGEMTRAGAETAYNNIIANMRYAFRDPSALIPYLKITNTYKTFADAAINTKVAFYGYYKTDSKAFSMKSKSGNTYSYKGVPVPLIILAREYGTSSGEAKVPFFRKSFKKAQIEKAMKAVQDKYFKDGE